MPSGASGAAAVKLPPPLRIAKGMDLMNGEPVHIYHGAYRPCNGFVLSYTGSLVGAIEVDGIDPDGMSHKDMEAFSIVIRNLLNILPQSVVLQHYYVHYRDQKVSFAPRTNPVCNALNSYRERHLNRLRLAGARCVLFVEMLPERQDQSSLALFLRHLSKCLRDPASRDYVKRFIMYGHARNASKRALDKLAPALETRIRDIINYCSGLFRTRQLDLDETYRVMKFLATLEVNYLDSGLRCPQVIDTDLSDGQVTPISLNGMDILRLQNRRKTYARVLSVKQFNFDRFSPGLFARGPIKTPGNYVLTTRYKGMTEASKTLFFFNRKKELERETLSFTDFIKGLDGSAQKDRDMQVFRPSLIRKFQELDEAASLKDNLGLVATHAVVFDADIKELEQTTALLQSALQQNQFSILWETVAQTDVFFDLQPCADHRGRFFRDIPLNTSQFSTLALFYKSAQGSKTVDDLGDEEAQYIFLSGDASPYYFSPFTGGRGFLIGVGPVRSGKSFLRTCTGIHWPKYGGFYRAIDIDPGSEPIAHAFGADAGIIRFDGAQALCLNFFSQARGPDDTLFIAHLNRQLMAMISTNDSEELRRMSGADQLALDRAIRQALRLPRHLQSLTALLKHCPGPVQRKLARFAGNGAYARLFDAEQDAIGSMDRKVAVYNLAGIRDDSVAKPLVMAEIAYRVMRFYENPAIRACPKWLDVDECHHILSDRELTRTLLLDRVRTWGKLLAGIGMWTQSGIELGNIENWEALRSAASTFIFTADPELNRDAYRSIFNLKEGEMETIKSMIPKREFYLIQRDLNVSKKCILSVEPEQYVLSTSSPAEQNLYFDNVERYGFAAGVSKTMAALAGHPGMEA